LPYLKCYHFTSIYLVILTYLFILNYYSYTIPYERAAVHAILARVSKPDMINRIFGIRFDKLMPKFSLPLDVTTCIDWHSCRIMATPTHTLRALNTFVFKQYPA